MKKLLVLLLLSLIVFAGCKKKKSTDTDPNHVQQEIWYIYQADNLDSYFGIRFYDTDWYTRIILSSPSYVKLNDLDMVLNPANSYYELTYDNEQVPLGTFLYSDTWGRHFTNSAGLEKSIGLPQIDTLYKNKDNVITWVGDPCGTSESVTIYVGLILNIAKTTTTQTGSTSLTIKGSDLALWNEGSLRVRIDREKRVPLQQGTDVGGQIITRYESVIRRVYIK